MSSREPVPFTVARIRASPVSRTACTTRGRCRRVGRDLGRRELPAAVEDRELHLGVLHRVAVLVERQHRDRNRGERVVGGPRAIRNEQHVAHGIRTGARNGERIHEQVALAVGWKSAW